MLISNPQEFRDKLRKSINKLIKDEKISTNLEKAIFNYTIQESKQKKIVKKLSK